MSLTLHYHPLASFCWKTLVALYENGTPFTPEFVDLSNEEARNRFYKISPTGKFPVIVDSARNQTLLESTILNEYLDVHYPGPVPLIPKDADQALEARTWDRFFDFYVHIPMQKIVLDNLRPEGKRDEFGVNEAKDILKKSYETLNAHLATHAWCIGDTFSLADCSAMPALYYAMRVVPLDASHTHIARYTKALFARPACARVLKEAEPYLKNIPGQ